MCAEIYHDIDGDDFKDEIEEFPGLRKIWEDMDGDLEDFFKSLANVLWQTGLFSTALSAEPVHDANIAEFTRLIENDFANLCKNDPTPTDVASAAELSRIRDSMKSIAAFPELYSRAVGAVGGGFSSGKSAFINSFLTSRKLRLAEGIRPVTAIPSYVLYGGEEASVTGVNYRGGNFPVPPELYKRLSHEELKKLEFNLKYLIQYIAVHAPLEPKYFANLCLLDTPGYNPPESGSEREDRKTAASWLEKADFLIWVIGLDTNGTLSKEDLEFLDNFSFGKSEVKKLYIVCNKCDLRPEGEVKEILRHIRDVLNANLFNWAGITAYSSSDKKAPCFIREDIYSFLARQNTPVNLYEEYQSLIDKAFSDFFIYINADCDRTRALTRKIRRLELTALESGAIGLSGDNSELETGLAELRGEFRGSHTREERLSQVSELKNRFKATFEKFCQDLGLRVKKRRFCGYCGKEIQGAWQSCPYCKKPF